MPGEAGGRRAQNANLKVNDRSGSIVLKNSNWGSNAGPIHALAHEGDVERRSASFRRPMSAPALVLVGVGQFSRQAFDEFCLADALTAGENRQIARKASAKDAVGRAGA